MGMLFIFIFILWNVITYFIMGEDKIRAQKDKWRISERTLLILAFLMGGSGIAAGMISQQHKTKHQKFLILVPMAVILNFAILYWLLTIIPIAGYVN